MSKRIIDLITRINAQGKIFTIEAPYVQDELPVIINGIRTPSVPWDVFPSAVLKNRFPALHEDNADWVPFFDSVRQCNFLIEERFAEPDGARQSGVYALAIDAAHNMIYGFVDIPDPLDWDGPTNIIVAKLGTLLNTWTEIFSQVFRFPPVMSIPTELNTISLQSLHDGYLPKGLFKVIDHRSTDLSGFLTELCYPSPVFTPEYWGDLPQDTLHDKCDRNFFQSPSYPIRKAFFERLYGVTLSDIVYYTG